MKLGTLLLRNAAIGLTQLEGALRNQVLYGGRLGTNLVELGFIDLDLLTAYLGELMGLPVATPAMLDGAEPSLLAKIGAEDAHRLRSIPLGDLGDPEAIAVAMVDPADTEAVAELSGRLASKIAPYIVPELRALYYLEKLFGLPRRARFVRTASAVPGQPLPSEAPPSEPSDNRRREHPAAGMVLPPALTLEPRRRRGSSLLSVSDVIPLATTFAATCERIDAATRREDIAGALVAYAEGRCDAMVVFLIRDGNALGWRGWVAPPAQPRQEIEDISLPLGGASGLQTAHDTLEVFVGAPPSEGKPVETRLWGALGITPEPTTIVVVPITVRQRAVNLLYAHAVVGPLPTAVVTELTELAVRVQAAYLRLIKSSRGP